MKLPKPKEGGAYEPCPPGNHVAICYGVVDIGTQKRVYQNETKVERRIRIMWEIPEEQMSDGRPFSVSREYKLSGHEKAALRKHLDSWRGKKFSDEDFENFDLKMLLGKGCMVQVVHNEVGDKTYVNVETIGSLPKGMKVGQTSNDHLYFSLEPEEYNHDAFLSLSEWTQGHIAESPEFKEIHGKAPAPAKKSRTVDDYAGQGAAAVAEEEDIPF
jgi:hypothetical protein